MSLKENLTLSVPDSLMPMTDDDSVVYSMLTDAESITGMLLPAWRWVEYHVCAHLANATVMFNLGAISQPSSVGYTRWVHQTQCNARYGWSACSPRTSAKLKRATTSASTAWHEEQYAIVLLYTSTFCYRQATQLTNVVNIVCQSYEVITLKLRLKIRGNWLACRTFRLFSFSSKCAELVSLVKVLLMVSLWLDTSLFPHHQREAGWVE